MLFVSDDKPKNGSVSLQLPRDVDARLEAYCTRRSKVKRATVTRLVERFLASPEPVKSVLLGEEEEGLESAYADWLERTAQELRAKGQADPDIIIDGKLGEFAPQLGPEDQAPKKRAKRPARNGRPERRSP